MFPFIMSIMPDGFVIGFGGGALFTCHAHHKDEERQPRHSQRHRHH
jgi:hypothetical protein